MLAVTYGVGFSCAQASDEQNFGVTKARKAALVKQLRSPSKAEKVEENQPEAFSDLVVKYNNLLSISRNKALASKTREIAEEQAKAAYKMLQTKYPGALEAALASPVKSPRKKSKSPKEKGKGFFPPSDGE